MRARATRPVRQAQQKQEQEQGAGPGTAGGNTLRSTRFHGNAHTRVAVCPLGAAAADPAAWVAANRPAVKDVLHRHGALLLRGFRGDTDPLLRFAQALADAPAHSLPTGACTPFRPRRTVALHHEGADAARPPALALLLNAGPASAGALHLADGRAVLGLLPEPTVRRLGKGLVHTRSYPDRSGPGDQRLSWQERFGTADRGEVESRCRASGTSYEWSGNGALRTHQHRPAVVRDPRTGAPTWFPRVPLTPSTRLTDGTPVPEEDLAAVRAAHAQAGVALRWRTGDLMVLDNVLVGHAREPAETGPGAGPGRSRVLVAVTAEHP